MGLRELREVRGERGEGLGVEGQGVEVLRGEGGREGSGAGSDRGVRVRGCRDDEREQRIAGVGYRERAGQGREDEPRDPGA